MKRIICTLLLLALFSGCLTCCAKENTITDDNRVNVLTTIFPPYDFAKEVGGEHINAAMLMAPETDSHSYTGDNPSDILKIAESDLFIYIGGESEQYWVDKVLSSIERSGMKVPLTLNMSEYCNLLEENSDGILQNDNSSHDHSNEPHNHNENEEHECSFDEHLWTSIKNAEIMVWAIAEKLSFLDSENATAYTDNALAYSEKLFKLDENFRTLFENSNNKTVVFADRFPFSYFAHDYSLEHYAAFSGCSSEAEVSPTTLSMLTDTMEEKNIKDVFYIETSKSDVPDLLCHILGADKHLLHSCHTVTEKQLKDGVTYISLMENNYETLRKAFSND